MRQIDIGDLADGAKKIAKHTQSMRKNVTVAW